MFMHKGKKMYKDNQVDKKLKWLILRLIRMDRSSEEELLEKLKRIYIGGWIPNKNLVYKHINCLLKEDTIKKNEGKYLLTEKGLEVLKDRKKRNKKSLNKRMSKEACAVYSMWGNIMLSALEFIVGFLSGSIGLIADAIHTAVDIIASAITWIGIKLDKEAQAALIGGIVLCGIGVFIAFESMTKVFRPADIQIQTVALITIVVNIIINGFFSFYKFYVGGRTRSISLVADAYHTKTDIWSSIAVLIGLLGASMGFPVLDSVAGAVVSVFIFIGGYELISESKEVLQGKNPDLEKFSKFLQAHLQVLPKRGAFVVLWLLNIQPMSRQECLQKVKEVLGKRFPVGLKDSDYKNIFSKLKKENLINLSKGKFNITENGREALEKLAKEPVASRVGTRRNFIDIRRIHSFSEDI